MQYRSTLAVAAAAALSAGAIVAMTSSARPTRARVHARAVATTVHVIGHAITDTENPGVGGAEAKGNILTFNNPVFDPSDTKQVGHDQGFCTRVSVKQGIWECLPTTLLKGGQITVQGPYYDKRNSVLSITGGTRSYSDSRGQMPLRSRNGGNEYDFIFQPS